MLLCYILYTNISLSHFLEYFNRFIAIKYENIPIIIATNQDGNTVDNLRPTPNCRNEPSLL
jgi:hypothetical protein